MIARLYVRIVLAFWGAALRREFNFHRAPGGVK